MPLWFFPDWFTGIAGVLPFASSVSTPVSLFVGRIPVSQAGLPLATQMFWCLSLAAATRALWALAHRHVIAQGG